MPRLPPGLAAGGFFRWAWFGMGRIRGRRLGGVPRRLIELRFEPRYPLQQLRHQHADRHWRRGPIFLTNYWWRHEVWHRWRVAYHQTAATTISHSPLSGYGVRYERNPATGRRRDWGDLQVAGRWPQYQTGAWEGARRQRP